jgi:hypothetical protein
MSRRLRIPTVLAVVVVGTVATACESGRAPADAQPVADTPDPCVSGAHCVQDPNSDAGVCPTIGTCADFGTCPPGCLVS